VLTIMTSGRGEPVEVYALPPLKVVQLLGNACLSLTTLAPKGPFRPRGARWILWFSLFSEEPHRVNSNDLVGALGAGPRPEGVGRPAAWLATVSRRYHSVDVFQRGRFLFLRQPLTSPLPKNCTLILTPVKQASMTLPGINISCGERPTSRGQSAVETAGETRLTTG
jgi:hypothetical protein